MELSGDFRSRPFRRQEWSHSTPPEQPDEWAQSTCIRLERNLLSLMPPPHACFWSGRAVFSPLSSFIYITRSVILSSSLSVSIPFLQTVSTLPYRSLDFCLSHANIWWKPQYFISHYFLFTLWSSFRLFLCLVIVCFPLIPWQKLQNVAMVFLRDPFSFITYNMCKEIGLKMNLCILDNPALNLRKETG